MHHQRLACSAAMGLGSHELGVAAFAAKLYHAGLFPVAVFSGASSPTTAEVFPLGEGIHFSEHALDFGVPIVSARRRCPPREYVDMAGSALRWRSPLARTLRRSRTGQRICRIRPSPVPQAWSAVHMSASSRLPSAMHS